MKNKITTMKQNPTWAKDMKSKGSLFVTGDKHGEISIEYLGSNFFPEGKYLTKDDIVLVTGDFGLAWSNPQSVSERKWIEWLNNKPWTTVFIDGNHENFDILDNLPEAEKFGAPVGVLSKNIFHLKRGYIYNLCGSKCFCFGGAMSVDKHHRAEGVSWWSREIPSYTEIDRGMRNLEKCNWDIDYVFTHTVPFSVLDTIDKMIFGMGVDKKKDPTCKYLDYFFKKVSFKKWFFGHYHIDTEPFFIRGSLRNKGFFQGVYSKILPIILGREIEISKNKTTEEKLPTIYSI